MRTQSQTGGQGQRAARASRVGAAVTARRRGPEARLPQTRPDACDAGCAPCLGSKPHAVSASHAVPICVCRAAETLEGSES